MYPFLVCLLSLLASATEAFGGGVSLNTLKSSEDRFASSSRLFLASTATSTSSKYLLDNIAPKTWEDLEKSLEEQLLRHPALNDEREPVLTFYRDTNGWCPFCERVWVCLRAKNLPYRERLISLFNKPEWYKDLVPTTQVPAVLFHNDYVNENQPSQKNERRLVWESLDIMKALDEMFPETLQLVFDTQDYQGASQQIDFLTKAGFAYIYATRDNNNNMTEIEMEEKKKVFVDALDELESALTGSDNDGPFRLGSNFTGIDAEMIPALERWRYQLPLSKGFDILHGRPGLQKWFEAIDTYAPYSDRVAGDIYSWTAASAMFARYFGNNDDAETRATIERSESVAKDLMNKLQTIDEFSACEGKFALEAARKIISNREAIVNDCTNPDPKSQQNVPRSNSRDNANKIIQFVTEILLKGDDALVLAKNTSLVEFTKTLSSKEDAATAARTIASRLSIPRDMSAPAGSVLRSVLMLVSRRLLEEK